MARTFKCAKCGQVHLAKPAGRLPTLCSECRRTARRVPFRVATCQACGQQFLPNGSTGPLPSRCDPCQLARRRSQTRESSARWKAANPEANRAQAAHYKREWISKPRNRRTKREYEILRQYGITAAQLDEMLEQQGHLCAICRQEHVGSGGRLHIDHCHATGAIRGLLCGNCNRGLGLFADSPDRLRAAALYLEAAKQEE